MSLIFLASAMLEADTCSTHMVFQVFYLQQMFSKGNIKTNPHLGDFLVFAQLASFGGLARSTFLRMQFSDRLNPSSITYRWWELKKKFFTQWVVRHWSRLPREVVSVPGDFRLDRALSNLIYLWVSLFIAGGLDQMAFKDPFHLK